MKITVEMEPEPHAAVTCGRGRCQDVLMDLAELKHHDYNWPIDCTTLAQICYEHLPECRCGKLTIGDQIRRIG
jgi:hypothetical protein